MTFMQWGELDNEALAAMNAVLAVQNSILKRLLRESIEHGYVNVATCSSKWLGLAYSAIK